MNESAFQKKVIKFLDDEGIYYVNYWGGGIYTRSGIPDLLCCVNGKFTAVELKTDTGRVSELQKYNIDRIIKSGGTALVLRPSDFESFKSVIKNRLIMKL